jgi:hypothetical protein
MSETMTNVNSELLRRVSELRDCMLQSIGYSAESRDIRIVLRHWNGSMLTVHLNGVLQLNVSSSEVGVENEDSVVVGAAIKALEDGGKEVLGSLGHFFCDLKGKEVNGYPDISLLYFSIDGDTCIGIVCREIEFVAGGMAK